MTSALFVTSFSFILLAAAPGRTTFVLILLASHGHLKRIFVGAAAAFLVQSLIAILLGGVLALFPKFIMELLLGLLFLYFGFSFWRQSLEPLEKLQGSNRIVNIRSVFALIFMAEFGDVSQLAIATTAAKSSSKPVVFIAAVSALWTLTAIALFFGHHLKRAIKPHLIQRMAGIAFFGIGVLIIVCGALSQWSQ